MTLSAMARTILSAFAEAYPTSAHYRGGRKLRLGDWHRRLPQIEEDVEEREAFLEAVENPHADAGGGAGNRVAEWMAERGVQTMVAGNFGRNLAADLEKRGIGRVEASGSSEDAVKAL